MTSPRQWRVMTSLPAAYRLGPGVAQEALEVAALEQLEDDVARVLLEADADEAHDVGVRELAHDERLH